MDNWKERELVVKTVELMVVLKVAKRAAEKVAPKAE
jgi:hypothetical protein